LVEIEYTRVVFPLRSDESTGDLFFEGEEEEYFEVVELAARTLVLKLEDVVVEWNLRGFVGNVKKGLTSHVQANGLDSPVKVSSDSFEWAALQKAVEAVEILCGPPLRGTECP
jgi:hypothetical protein